MINKLVAVMAAMVAVSTAYAQSDELGPAVGETLPHDLTTIAYDGSDTNFDALVGEKGMALFFVRSVDWCPYCRAQAVDVSTRAAEFADRGLKVVFVSYDPPAKQRPFVQKWSFKPQLISDESIEIINAFGIRNTKHEQGSRFYGIPHPVVFLVDAERKILGKLYEEDFAQNDKSYRQRPAVEKVLEMADAVFVSQ